jgi:hypothetical protein
MSAQAKLIMAVALLIAVGGGMAGYKSSKLGVPFWEGDQVNEWLVRDGFKPLDEARHQALINARESY